ncbi:HGGxSTG domain-containing protein [Roseovarius sp.]|uniref:HGGxSTG domain-containing protein n=1 Tax=Roseovarius sp. TaxID=1486281 RepID=UPI00343D0A68
MLEDQITVFGGATAARCQARSKRSGQQCRKPAIKGKRVCRTHGGVSTGPRTPQGRQRCAEARMVHGREGRETRNQRAAKLRELRQIEAVMVRLGMVG